MSNDNRHLHKITRPTIGRTPAPRAPYTDLPVPEPTHPTATLNLTAGIGAALVPGLGHVLRGETKRGIIAGAAILFLFFSGILIGGIDVIDSREDRVWFIGQALVGPIAFGVDYVHQEHLKAYGPETGLEDGRSPAIVSRSGRPDEMRVLAEAVVPVDPKQPNGPTKTIQRYEWQRLTPQDLAAGMGPPNSKSVAKVNEIGTLYATLAGMVNLIVIIDALVVTPRKRRETVVTASDKEADA